MAMTLRLTDEQTEALRARAGRRDAACSSPPSPSAAIGAPMTKIVCTADLHEHLVDDTRV